MSNNTTHNEDKEAPDQKFDQNDIALKNIVSNLPGHVYWKDNDGVYLGCNDRQAQSLGLVNSADLVGKTDYELPWGKQVADKFRENDLRIMETGIAEIIEESAKVNGKQGIVLSHKLPLKDQNGKIIGILGISLDITQHKKDQEALQTIKHQLKGARLISASIAHEIRTPLATIKSGIAILKKKVNRLIQHYEKTSHIKTSNIKNSDISDIEECIVLINKKTDQCNIIINMLLTKLNNVDFNFNEFSDCSADDCVKSSLEKFVMPDFMTDKINYDAKNNFKFFGSSTLITHVIMNLLKNSIFYILKAKKGQIYIWFENKLEVNEIHFKDTASGISKNVLEHIFQPFFTTESSTGTGVGLAFSKMVMESHRGSIDCFSEEGAFTEFILTFSKIS